MNIAILLFNEVDLLDAGGPYEVFLTASRLVEREGGQRPFTIQTVTLDGNPTTAYGGLGLIPHGSIDEVADADVLIVPGTIDIDTTMANQPLIDTIAKFSKAKHPDRVTASVCTGSFLLAQAGLLVNRKWTTHWEDVDLLAEQLSVQDTAESGAVNQVRWVDSGSIVTAAGLSSGIDMALHLVERFAGLTLAEKTATQLDYKWDKTGATHA